MNDLDAKINKHFPGLVVRKDLVKIVKGNAIVPSYVLEYLLGQYCATDEEATIATGIENVKKILANHYVHRNEAGLVRSTIREKGRNKVIDKVFVIFNEKNDCYEAEFSNLGIKKIIIGSETVKKHPKLLVSGVWCIADIEYEYIEDRTKSPWLMTSLRPIQLSDFNFNDYLNARQNFTTLEWIDLLIQSMGFNPEFIGYRNKLLQLVRLIPFCERNYNLLELGPKGTGKSHVYSDFSPHGMLVSGGEVSVPKLFVNNSSGKLGLVGYWDVVALDEIAGKKKKVDKALVDILKNYMANKSFSRGIETLGAEASMVFVGNTQHTVPYMLKHRDLFYDLPDHFYDSAFIDRIHFYIPGWEVDVIRGEMFSTGYGFVVDYIAEILRHLRSFDYSDKYLKHMTLSPSISTRDKDGIHKTFSGLFKIIFPNGEASDQEIEEIMSFAIEGRKRVKDQLKRIDNTYPDVTFSYKNNTTESEHNVPTLEERNYPKHYHKRYNEEVDDTNTPQSDEGVNNQSDDEINTPEKQPNGNATSNEINVEELSTGHDTFHENQKGVTYDDLFGKYFKGCSKIKVTDPYIRIFFQIRNFMELVETICKFKSEEDEVHLHLMTVQDDYKMDDQEDHFKTIKDVCLSQGVLFTWEYDQSNTIHARHIECDNGWKILLDRGLDIYQYFEMNNAFVLENRGQQYRSCKAFEITYLKNN